MILGFIYLIIYDRFTIFLVNAVVAIFLLLNTLVSVKTTIVIKRLEFFVKIFFCTVGSKTLKSSVILLVVIIFLFLVISIINFTTI